MSHDAPANNARSQEGTTRGRYWWLRWAIIGIAVVARAVASLASNGPARPATKAYPRPAVPAPNGGGPAAKAGLEAGDLIVAYNGSPVDGIDALHRLLTAERINRPATVTVLRRTHRLELEVTATERPVAG